jgi:peptidoglycan/LPS O-acetylase OafA/YrhL
MKRVLIITVVAVLVIASSVLWFMNSPFSALDFLQLAVIGLLVVFAGFIAYKRLRSVKRGEPTEDELSKRVLQKTAALSYYISLYLWVFMIYLKDRISLDTEEVLGMGILGMAITFAVTWIILNLKGVKDE